MALSLAFLIGGVWTALAAVGLARRRPVRWDLWDSLRGRRPLPRQACVADWPALIELLGDGHRHGMRALVNGDHRSACSLARAELASTRSIAESLAADLRECSEQACVLQHARPTDRSRPATLHMTGLRLLFRLELAAAPILGPMGRLQLRLAVLRLAGRLLKRRVTALLRRPSVDRLFFVASLVSDAETLARAAVVERGALLDAWQTSSSRVRARFAKPCRPE